MTLTILVPTMIHFAAASPIDIAVQRVGVSWPWYVTRAAGFIAAGLLVLLVLSGIGQVTGLLYRFIEPIRAWAIHKALAFALCASIVVHVGFLLIDKFLPFSLAQILVPFASAYNNGTSLWGVALGGAAVSFGIIAMYGIVVVVLSSLGWINTKKTAWRKLHYLSYAVAGLVFLHAVYIGTDLKYGLFRQLWLGLGGLIAVGVVVRLWRAGVVKKDIVPSDNQPSA